MKNIVLLLLLVPACLGAYDMGLLLDQNVGLSGDDSGSKLTSSNVDYTATVIPRFSLFFGESSSWEVFVSAGITANYEIDEWSFIPELLRTEISGRIGSFRMKAGRTPYSAPSNFVVSGLFDGAQVFFDTAAGTFNAGAWYTGFLYKEKAHITMTSDDFISYYTPMDYNDFVATYFASRRLLAALGWEHPSLVEIVRLKFALIGQYDLNESDNPYHSQYASLKAGILIKRINIELGGVFQAAEAVEAPEEDFFTIGYAGELGFSWALPGSVHNQISLNGQYSSGKAETGMAAAFVPITANEHGSIIKARFSGISIINLDYTIRLHQTLSTGLTTSYFIRNDLGTYTGYPISGLGERDGHYMGLEFFGRVIWSPFSDLRLNLGGSVFLPSAGNAAPKTEAQWRVELGALFSFY